MGVVCIASESMCFLSAVFFCEHTVLMTCNFTVLRLIHNRGDDGCMYAVERMHTLYRPTIEL